MVGALTAAIGELGGLDLSLVHPDALPELVRDLSRARTQLDAACTRAIGEMERRQAYRKDGHRSARDWLSGELHVDPRKASRDAKLARDLNQMPKLADAYAEGEISEEHVQVAARAVKKADPVERESVEDELCAAAKVLDPGKLGRQARARRIRERPADAIEDERRAFAERAARYVTKPDGGATFIQELTPGDYEVHRSARQAYLTKDPKDLPESQRRSFAQKLYDADLEIARRALTADDAPTRNGAPATGTVIVPLETLAAAPDTSAEPAQLGFAGPVSSETARRMLCDAHICRLVVGPRSEPLDVGRSQRSATAAQARALLGIWHGCARCGAPPGFVEIHHIIFWDHGGPTDLDNLLPLCWSCHSAVHHAGLLIRRSQDGTVTFTAPNGVAHHRAPPGDDRTADRGRRRRTG